MAAADLYVSFIQHLGSKLEMFEIRLNINLVTYHLGIPDRIHSPQRLSKHTCLLVQLIHVPYLSYVEKYWEVLSALLVFV